MHRLILNGKSAGIPNVRAAVDAIRDWGQGVQVRVTWEEGDAAFYASEAAEQGFGRVIAGGGDGTLHEIVNGLMQIDTANRPAIGFLPLGTANDFANASGIPLDPLEALTLAVKEAAVPIDVGNINDDFFLNALSAGFGAEITASTPLDMKRKLGGAAYTVMGVILALNFRPYEGRIEVQGGHRSVAAMIGVVGNGRRVGGGKELAPKAYLNDGLLDVMILNRFTPRDLPIVAEEIRNLSEEGKFISYIQTPGIKFENKEPVPVNLDGEPRRFAKACVRVVPNALRAVLPVNCPLLRP